MHPILNKLDTTKKQLQSHGLSEDAIRVYLKEHLQNNILNILYAHPEYKNLIFYGGTCLRKLYDLNRMSEDLDFEFTHEPHLDEIGETIKKHFEHLELKTVNYSTQRGKHISRIAMKFPILYELGLSNNPGENLHGKIEINDKIEGLFETQFTPVVVDSMSMIIKHYTIETLMAGKMLACVDRIFRKGTSGIEIKGRDYYDLVWFMQKGIQPDEKRLVARDPKYSVEKVFTLIDEKVAEIKPRDLLIDLEILFDDTNFIREWCSNFHDFYARYRKRY